MDKKHLIYKLSDSIKQTSKIEKSLFAEKGVKRGLRNADQTGVLAGLSRIGNVIGFDKKEDGSITSCEGRLFYRGINVADLVHGIQKDNRLGFEETAYLLLSGYLPDKEELEAFQRIIMQTMPLEHQATMNILALKGKNIMNILARSVLELYTYDPNPDDISKDNLIRQTINLIAKFPTIIAYAYNVLRHDTQVRSLHIRHPYENKSVAENFLFMIKGRDKYTELDVKILDLALILHAEHGGGNNSTFTVRVTSSSETDTYSSIAAGIGSLKGPLHGGANLKVNAMIDNIKENVANWNDNKELSNYLTMILEKKAFDKTGLIYGIGHAVYTKSDPRAILLKEMAAKLAKEKGLEKEFEFMQRIEKESIKCFEKFKGVSNKKISANVDFYSGFVYKSIGLPSEVFTPLFAMARIVGWSAHRIEELNFSSKRIIRPAYKNVRAEQEFIPLADR